MYALKWMPSCKAIMATCDSTAQRIVIRPPVVTHVQRYRQTWMFASEAGGQLFGTISLDAVNVEIATGPYPGDERSRYRYRSNPKAAQAAIEQQAKKGLLYLGEWHTHAEDHPSASSLDVDAMKRLIANSRLNSSALLMLIVGLEKNIMGKALFTTTSNGTEQWTLSSAD
ncbi:Mov34/MPN/PAD-1 family protein [Hydrogenophaga sp. IBVHS1]|uniref:Mov34/MPN/PAD-1 family protein n=1 Tax=unclassified Hydrogenophaga TaxID=2610897 RepID=UPI000A2E99EA|nr:Mov34/MPN/PAD-1 family protein [Hydrogenophaga sp. IBVHS1]OSZ76015.1 hypothetical protein CAP37_11845 [Hydrogenophaga sp. IBVHS1]